MSSRKTSISALLTNVWNTQRFTELGREEKGEGADRQPGREKGESKGGESGQASNLALK